MLFNGLRINDAQIGHHSMDIPVPLEVISRIEVLTALDPRNIRADALGGAANFITAPPERDRSANYDWGGTDGFNQQRVVGSSLGKRWSEQVAASRDSSDGFIADRDYRSRSASAETRFTTAVGTTDVLLAGSDRPFGASHFYADFPSWERTKTWFASINQEMQQATLSRSLNTHPTP